MIRLGTQVPDHINDQIENLRNILRECLPYEDEMVNENVSLMEKALEVGAELTRYVTAIIEYRNTERGLLPRNDDTCESAKDCANHDSAFCGCKCTWFIGANLLDAKNNFSAFKGG